MILQNLKCVQCNLVGDVYVRELISLINKQTHSSRPRSDAELEYHVTSAGRARQIKKHARTKHKVRMRKKSLANVTGSEFRPSPPIQKKDIHRCFS